MSPLSVAQVALTVALVAIGVRYLRALRGQPLSAPPAVYRAEPAKAQPRLDIFAPEPEKRIEAFRELERLAAADPGRRQRFVDHVLAQLGYRMWSGSQARLWSLVIPHLRPHTKEFWPGIDLRAGCAVVTGLDLANCEVRTVVFERVRFVGDTHFSFTVFTGDVSFEGSCFARHVRFRQAKFRGAVAFDDVTFTGTAWFRRMEVAGPASFTRARFSGHTEFTGAAFGGPVSFLETGFAGRTSFRDTGFGARTRFADARFTGHADFAGTSFVDEAGLARAWARTDWYAIRTWPAGWAADGEPVELPRRPGRWARLHG